MDTTKTTINCLSFCSGIRGIERGLERVVPNLRTVCHVEIEAVIIENLVAEMEAGLVAPAPIWSNIKTFDPEPFRGKIHVLTGGYPCQPFSNAGKRNGEEDPRHLFPYIAKAVDVVRPDICFFDSGGEQNSERSEFRTGWIEQSSINSWRAEQGENVERQKGSVARPGQVQHEWERPRTISYAEETTEPSLGLSAHGYRFREDVLRALGNSVYSDTAELAWNVLSKKHGLI